MKSLFGYLFKEAGTAELGKPPYYGDGNFETIETLDAGPAMSGEFL